MRIIRVDNFGREEIADVLIAESVNEYWGNRIVDALNEKHKFIKDDSEYFRLVDDDFVLWCGMAELI